MTCIVIMTFRRKYEVLRKSWIPKECAEAGNDFSKVEVIGLPTDTDLLALELWSAGHLFIDDAVELLAVAV
jgi:hypothetical protein